MRQSLLIATTITLLLLYASAERWGQAYSGSTEFHTILEVAAFIMAFVVGVGATVRHYAQRAGAFLFIGLGFIATGCLDLYHTIVTSTAIQYMLPSGAETLIPWSWSASRMMLSALMATAAFARPGVLRKRESLVYGGLVLVMLFVFFFFVLASLPPAYYPEYFWGRPQEIIPGVIFAAALFGYLRRGYWKSDAFEISIVLSLIIGTVVQCLIMCRSFVLFDAMFDMAHTLKIGSYLVPAVGLMTNFYVTFRRELTARLRLVHLIETNLVAFFVTTADGRFIQINQRLADMVGLTKKEVMGRRAHEFYRHPEQRLEILKILSEKGRVINYEIEVVNQKTGDLVFGLFSAHYDGTFLDGNIIDITERKKVEREKQEIMQLFLQSQRTLLAIQQSRT